MSRVQCTDPFYYSTEMLVWKLTEKGAPPYETTSLFLEYVEYEYVEYEYESLVYVEHVTWIWAYVYTIS